MIDHGVNVFIEIGPGRVLSGLISRINSQINVLNVEDNESFKKVQPILKQKEEDCASE
jgi:[acyl-carrier-protein] S-malonyltransferase